jgi:hypothetical protein
METIEKITSQEKHDYIELLWMALIYLSIQIVFTAHYLLIKRKPEYIPYFGAVQSVFVVIGIMEDQFR